MIDSCSSRRPAGAAVRAVAVVVAAAGTDGCTAVRQMDLNSDLVHSFRHIQSCPVAAPGSTGSCGCCCYCHNSFCSEIKQPPRELSPLCSV